MKKVECAEKNTKAIDRWIKDISDLHRSKPPPTVHYSKYVSCVLQHLKAFIYLHALHELCEINKVLGGLCFCSFQNNKHVPSLKQHVAVCEACMFLISALHRGEWCVSCTGTSPSIPVQRPRETQSCYECGHKEENPNQALAF